MASPCSQQLGETAPSMEEVRKRRLAYYQSASTENQLENQSNLKNEALDENQQSAFQQKRPLPMPHGSKEKNDLSSHKDSSNLLSKAKIDKERKVSGSKPEVVKKPKSNAPRQTASNDVLSKDWNSHVEHLFNREQMRRKEDEVFSRKDSHELLRESQDLDAVSMFKSEADCETLGLETHRPDSDRPSLLNRNNSNSAFLEESLSDEMKNLLGEAKYKEFVDKSMKDINELYHHKTTETSPHLIKSFIEDQAKEATGVKQDEEPSTEMNNRPNSNSPRHRLHRPKKEPVHIQNLVTKTKRDLELEGPEVSTGTGKNYEQVTVSRNVTYSADEIYRQAFGAPAPPIHQQMMTPPPQMSYSQGMPFHPGMMLNMPPSPGTFQSPPGAPFPPDVSHPPPGHYMYPTQPEMYTPRSPTNPASPHLMYYQQYKPDPNFHGYPVYGNMYQSQPFPPSSYPAQYPPNYPPPVHVPHPPPQPPLTHQQVVQPPLTHQQVVQHPAAHNHPPPQMYYSYPQSIPHMVPHPPAERKEEGLTEQHFQSYEREQHVEGKMKPKQSRDEKNRHHDHHRNPQKLREEDPMAPDRHIEAIRIHHEQRRQMQEDKMNEVIHLEKQKKFAKASLDRYFSSLENIYRAPTSNQGSLSQTEEDSEEMQQEEQTQQHVEGENEDTFTSVTATSVKAGGITERLEDLGIDLANLKTNDEDTREDDSRTKKKKKVKVCPNCSSWNKEYMSWCADCGEILIGVESVVAKKKEKRKVVKEKEEAVTMVKEEKTERPLSTRRNVSISQEIMSYRNDKKNEVSVSKPDTDGSLNHLENAGKALAVPKFNTGSSNYVRSPQEINDLCEVISDPVIRGFIKNYFSRKSGPQNESEPHHDQAEDVQYEETAENDDFVAANDEETDEREETPKGEDLSEGEVILNLAASVDSTLHPKACNSPKASRHREHGDIDVEVFAIEGSKQSRTSSHNTPVVPMLDLHDSSDDEEVIQRRRQAMATQPVSFSVDTDDLSSIHDSQQLDVKESELCPEEGISAPPHNSFLSHILAMRSNRGEEGRSRPSSADLIDRKRMSKSVKETIEAEPYQRHWERSSIAWASYHPRELNTRSSLQNVMMRDSRVKVSGNVENMAGRGDAKASGGGTKKARPASADLYKRKAQNFGRPTSAQVRPSSAQVRPAHPTGGQGDATPTLSPSQPNIIAHRLPPEEAQMVPPIVLQGPSSAITAYDKYNEMTPRIADGQVSKWQCLPDEIWLYVFSYLQHRDLVNISLACKQFCRIAVDESLWKYITVKKKDGICDEWLNQIAMRHPVSLALIQCHGDNVTAKGLRDLFRESTNCLRELNFSRCSRGGLTGDGILLHASARCRNLTHVDASWCHVTDNGIVALSDSAHRLESLCLNGCQMLSDDGIETVIKKHGASLRVLEMFGCFNMTARSIRCVATHCTNLLTLNLGQCFRLTDSCISQLSASLGRVEHLDLRGCKQIKDNCIRKIVRNCPRLKTITIANCQHISDAALIEIATYSADIRSIDICGCRHVTDHSIRTLSNNCQRLTQLDISSSGCSHRSVLLLANYCNRNLEVLKLNFLADVTEQSLQKLVKHCKKLKTLHLYGCTSVRSIDKLKQICPFLHVEM